MVGLKKNNTTYITHTNLRGDIESITDLNGSIVAQAHYDPWGNQITYSGSLVQPFRYAGYYYDDETGLYYLKSRYYSPTLGRFLTRDGIGYVKKSNPQTLNLYSYCENNPVSFTDPNGNIVTDWDKLHLSSSELEDVEEASDEWTAAHARGDKAGMDAAHAKANGARSPHMHSGETIDSSGYVHGYSSSPSSSQSIPSQIWAGATCEGWTPYVQTSGAVVLSGTVVYTAGGASMYYTAGGSITYMANYASDVLGAPPPTSNIGIVGSGSLMAIGVDPLNDFLFGNPK